MVKGPLFHDNIVPKHILQQMSNQSFKSIESLRGDPIISLPIVPSSIYLKTNNLIHFGKVFLLLIIELLECNLDVIFPNYFSDRIGDTSFDQYFGKFYV